MGMSNAALRMGFAVFLAALLAGCGGGGAGADADSEIAPLGGSADGRHGPPASAAHLHAIGGQDDSRVVDRPADLRRGGDVCGGGRRRRHRRRARFRSTAWSTARSPRSTRPRPTSCSGSRCRHTGTPRSSCSAAAASTAPSPTSPATCLPGRPISCVPLGRGYATFASDSGHQANALGSLDGSFGLNDEAIRNWSGEALKKTRDAAVFLIKARYAKSIRKAYFAGGSTGGREALESITRWPDDWDGAIAWYPAWKQASAILAGHAVSRALAKPGAYPASAAKRELLFNAAMEACDGLDGAMDGLINNQLRCNAIFDPATASVGGNPLRCPDGADTGDTCLSDAQITAMKTLNSDTRFNFELASGEDGFPGYNMWGADLGITTRIVAAGADRHLPGARHVAAHAADAVCRALHQQDDGSVDPVLHHPLARLRHASRSTRRTPARGQTGSAS